jgi:multiple sugar transport system ATP-binding protein
MASITFEHVTKRYADGFEAVKDMNLAIADGEFMVLVGPSGSGKSTALRMAAGLEDITDGVLKIGDEVVNDRSPRDRDIAMVFQNYALYPHMTVRQNMGFALKLTGTPRQEIDRKVEEAAKILDITRHLDRKPASLSGGQRQRVAMGRAIVRDPKAFLMDEPLSNLDAKLRVQTRTAISRLHDRLGTTTIYVTHDQIEALTLGDRVAVMLNGRLQQVATPEELYERPRNDFVASFIGSPSINMVEAGLTRSDSGLAVSFGGHTLAVDRTLARSALDGYIGRTVLLGIRPEDLEDVRVATDAPADRRIRTVCVLSESLGAEVLVYFEVEATGVVPVELDAEVDGGTVEHAPPTRRKTPGTSRFVARVSPRAPSAEGSPVELAVDTSRLYFFDPESGLAI